MDIIKKSFILGITIILMALFLIKLIDTHPYYIYHFYPGDKLEINVTVCLDEGIVPMEIKNLTCTYEGRKQKVSQKNNNGSYVISTKGNKYGIYEFTGAAIFADKEEAIYIKVIKLNNWDIMKYDLECHQYSNRKSEYCIVNLKHKNENGNDIKSVYEKALLKDTIGISTGNE